MFPGMLAAAAWLAAQPLIRAVTGSRFDDARLLGRLVTPDGPWRVVGSAIHLANGAIFGAAYSRLIARPSVVSAIAAAQLENALLWPSFSLIDRVHPDRRNGHWPPLATTPSIFAHEVLAHLVFGAVLGTIGRRRSRPGGPAH